MSEHTWFQENVAGYCADGLSTEERERFDRHRVACSCACAKMLTDEAANSMNPWTNSSRPSVPPPVLKTGL